MIDDEVELLAAQASRNGEETAGDVGGVAHEFAAFVGVGLYLSLCIGVEPEVHIGLVGVAVDVGDEHCTLQFERLRVVEQGAVHAAAVGPVDVHNLVAASAERGLPKEVIEDVAVFNL